MRLLLFILLCSSLSICAQTDDNIDSLYNTGNYVETKKLIEHFVADTSYYSVLARCEYHLGEWAQSKTHFEAFLEREPEDEMTLSYLARIYDQESNYGKAIKYYTKLISLDSNHVGNLKRSAALLLKSGEKTHARSLYERAYRLRSTDIVLAKDLGVLYLSIDSIDLADSIITNGLENNPEHVGMNLLAADLKIKKRDYASAIPFFIQARNFIDLNSRQRKLLGYAYLQIDSLDKAIYELENIVHSNEKEFIHYYLAIAYDKKNETEKALFHYDQAIDKSVSKRVDMYCIQASAICQEENNLSAALDYTKLAYNLTGKPDLYYNLATLSDLYYKDKSIAIRYYTLFTKHAIGSEDKKEYAYERARFLKEQLHQQ